MELRTTNLYHPPTFSIMDVYRSSRIVLVIVPTQVVGIGDTDVSYDSNSSCDQNLLTVMIGVESV